MTYGVTGFMFRNDQDEADLVTYTDLTIAQVRRLLANPNFEVELWHQDMDFLDEEEEA